jgi:hypothetical protein
MLRRFSIVALVGVLTALATGTSVSAGENGSDEATMCVYTTQLRAENEVPPTTSAASGLTQIKVRNDGTIEFKTHIVNPAGERFVAGHIHFGEEGMNGPVVQSLFQGGPNTEEQIMQSGEASMTPAGLGAAICADPTAYYINYHTTVFPGGAIRGQLG